MSVLDRDALQASPLADLHTIASELSIDGYRRLRRADLIDAILGKQGGESAQSEAEEEESTEAEAAKSTDEEESTETKPAKSGDAEEAKAAEAQEESAEVAEEDKSSPAEESGGERGSRRRRGRRGGRGRSEAKEEEATTAAEPDEAPEEAQEAEAPASETPAAEEELVEGVVELLPNGSGFVRVAPPEPSDDDVYISAAQVKRCELVSGDRIAGPRRAPRRSERFASLIKIDTINGRPADEVADSVRFEDLPVAFPDERFRLGSDDPTLKAIEWLTPIGRGSRVTIVGGSGSGKTEALRRLAEALASQEELLVSLALAGARPEEIAEWRGGPVAPGAAAALGSSSDAQAGAVELVVDQGRRVAARGAHAVILIDTLDGLHPLAARKALAAARKIVDGGSLTVIATATAPVGGETTVIALDRALASTGRFPALDLVASGTIRAERLVGDAGAEAIARARAEAMDAAH